MSLITLIICGSCALWLFWLVTTVNKPAFGSNELRGKVRFVVDGDSIYLSQHEPQVRIWGINAPEKGQEGFQEATNHLMRLTLNKTVKCLVMDKDRYGRTVGRCYLNNGQDVARLMLDAGLVREMKHFTKGYYSRD